MVSSAVLWLGMVLCSAVGAQIDVTPTNFDENTWLHQTDEIHLRIDRLPAPEEGVLAVFIGQTDITAQVRIVGGELTYSPTIIPLPSGQHELIVYLVPHADEWNEIARLSLKVLTPRGFEQAEMTPRLDLSAQSRLVESRSQDAGPAERSSPYADVQLQGGLNTHHEREGATVKTAFDFLGSTRQKDALRYGEQQNSAPKLDLSSYLIDGSYAGFDMSVGHISYGNNRHLLNNVANRGLVLKRRFGDRFDLSFNTMNGRSIVGYDNFFGLSDIDDNNIMAGTAGIDLFKNQYADLRLEGTLMRGRILPQVDFNVGQVVDAEESKGFGLRLFGSVWNERIRTDLSFSRSTFDNPNDGALSFGVDIVDVKKKTDNARYFEVAIDLLQNWQVTENKYASLTLTGRHERIDPQFRSIGTYINANQDLEEVALAGYLADFSFQFSYIWTEDNLDDIPSILTTKTRNASLNLGLPLRSLFSNPGFERPWLPTLTYGFNWTHQFGANRPTFEDSGFEDSSIPDQLDVLNTVGANWSGEWWNWNFSYQFMHSFQDNRQQGREEADFSNEMHMLSLGLQPLETLSFTLGYGWTDAGSEEEDLTRFTNTMSLGFEWRFLPRWLLAGAYSYTDEDDSDSLAIARNYTLETQLSWEFSVPSPTGRRIPGRFFLRHALQSNVNKDRVFIFASQSKVWTVDIGLSFSLF